MEKCVFYLRYSSAGQTEQSIEGQQRVCQEFCERNGYVCVHEYIDRALTGTSDNRASFQQMIADSKKADWKYVIVYKLDRFARNRYDSANYKYQLKQNGVKVISAMECISDTPEGVILESVIEGYAEYYSLNLSQNVLRGFRESISKGQHLGGVAPFGYRFTADKKVEVDEHEAMILRFFFNELAQGRAFKDVCQDANARGWRTRNGKEFDRASLHTALRNKKYIGEFEYKGAKTSIYPPIIDKTIFDIVQSILDARTHKHIVADTVNNSLLKGKIFCGHCEKPMVADSGQNRKGVVYRYYSCADHKKNKDLCEKQAEPTSVVDDYIVDQTLLFVKNEEIMESIQRQIKELYQETYNESELGQLDREISRAEIAYNKIVDKFIDADTPALIDALKQKAQYIQDHLEVLRDEREKMARCMHIDQDGGKFSAVVKALVDGDRNDEKFRKRLIDTFVSKVYVYNDKYIIFYNVTGYTDEDEQKIRLLSHSDECWNNLTSGRALPTLFQHIRITPYGFIALLEKSA